MNLIYKEEDVLLFEW